MPGFELYGDIEKKHLQDVIDSGIFMRYGFDAMRNGHWKALELEKAISDSFNVKHAQLVSSGTAALTTALAALNIGYNDEVILPTFTFVASFEAVISVGAIPVFADVDASLTLNPESVKQKITERTKLIMPVHMCGSMANMTALMDIAKEHNLLVLEDACQAIGGTYHGQHLGTIGHAGTFSFDFVKTITCAEGGAVITNDDEVKRSADAFSDHGHDHLGIDRGADLHPYMGYNFRISELHAALGLAQIGRLQEFLNIQKELKSIIKGTLRSVKNLDFRVIHDETGDNASFVSLFLPTEDLTRKANAALKAKGINNFYWFDNNWHYIKNWHHLKDAKSLYALTTRLNEHLTNLSNEDFSESDNIMKRCLSFPISLKWTPEAAQQYANTIKETLESILA